LIAVELPKITRCVLLSVRYDEPIICQFSEPVGYLIPFGAFNTVSEWVAVDVKTKKAIKSNK